MTQSTGICMTACVAYSGGLQGDQSEAETSGPSIDFDEVTL